MGLWGFCGFKHNFHLLTNMYFVGALCTKIPMLPFGCSFGITAWESIGNQKGKRIHSQIRAGFQVSFIDGWLDLS
jgi:hypothetical protein